MNSRAKRYKQSQRSHARRNDIFFLLGLGFAIIIGVQYLEFVQDKNSEHIILPTVTSMSMPLEWYSEGTSTPYPSSNYLIGEEHLRRVYQGTNILLSEEELLTALVENEDPECVTRFDNNEVVSGNSYCFIGFVYKLVIISGGGIKIRVTPLDAETIFQEILFGDSYYWIKESDCLMVKGKMFKYASVTRMLPVESAMPCPTLNMADYSP